MNNPKCCIPDVMGDAKVFTMCVLWGMRENEIGKIKRQYRVVNKAEISVNESQLRGGMPTKVPAMFFFSGSKLVMGQTSRGSDR